MFGCEVIAFLLAEQEHSLEKTCKDFCKIVVLTILYSLF